MISDDRFSVEQAVHSARSILQMEEVDRVALFHTLRRSKQLSLTVRGLNTLAADMQHRALALDALSKLGLGTPG